MYNERKNQIPGLMECLWETGGVSCEIIRGGTIRVGDTMKILTNTDGNRVPTDGGKPDGFYIRPKLRTAAIVKAMLEGKKRSKERLMETDKEGLLRLQRSYESVGLKY
jgi:hypothetical protein